MNKNSMLRVLFVVISAICLAGLAFAQTGDRNDLSGKYRIDNSRSENVSDIVESVSRSDSTSASERRDLARKLEAPEEISLEVLGKEVTLSTSSGAPPATFTADGKTRTSRKDDGSSVGIRASLRGGVLTISSLGGESDYTITFALINDGRAMRVTRRVTTSYLSQTVFADSVYTRVGPSPGILGNNDDDEVYSSSDPDDVPGRKDDQPSTRSVSPGNHIVPGGTVLTGTLETLVTTKDSQNNDRFRLTIQSPSEFGGSVISGYLSGIERTGRVSGRSRVTFNFETIKLSNGRTYDFSGVLQSITDKEGRVIRVNNEGEAKSQSRSTETAKRGGIGAGLGAIIGAIIGGGKGALIGATIGAGAGAGSVVAEGREDLVLEPGSEFSVRSSSPRNK